MAGRRRRLGRMTGAAVLAVAALGLAALASRPDTITRLFEEEPRRVIWMPGQEPLPSPAQAGMPRQ